MTCTSHRYRFCMCDRKWYEPQNKCANFALYSTQYMVPNIDGLVQDCSIYSAKALHIPQPCTKPPICTSFVAFCVVHMLSFCRIPFISCISILFRVTLSALGKLYPQPSTEVVILMDIVNVKPSNYSNMMQDTYCMDRSYRQVSNIRRTLVGNQIVDHSDVVGASPVGAASTTSSFSI